MARRPKSYPPEGPGHTVRASRNHCARLPLLLLLEPKGLLGGAVTWESGDPEFGPGAALAGP